MRARRRFIALFLFAALPAFLLAAGDEPDLAIVAKIRHEGIKRSEVMRLAGYLSDVIGPRPAGSPANDRANRWAADTMKGWGLENVALEPYGTFGVGWAPRYVSAHLLSPHYAPLQAISVEWGSSTKGRITGAPLHVSIATPADFAKYRGTLKGRIVLYQPPRTTAPHFTADARRRDAASLEALASYPIPDEDPPSADYVRGFLDELEEFFRAEDVGALVSPSSGGRGDYGATVAAGIRSARHPDRPRPLPEIILAVEHYNRIVRILDEHREPATMEVEVRTEFYDKDLRGYNVVAEIPGTDRKDEIVMLGGHIDSWSPGTGAADNAAGVAVSMEAVRILKAIGAKPRRTIRVVLWGAEEKGWVGFEGVRRQPFRRRRDDDAQAGARESVGLLQLRQRHRAHPRSPPAAERAGGADLRGVDEAVRGSRHDRALAAINDGIGSRGAGPGGHPGVPVDPGPHRLRHARAPLEPGRLRPPRARRSDPVGRHHGELRLPRGHARRDAAAQAAASAVQIPREEIGTETGAPYFLPFFTAFFAGLAAFFGAAFLTGFLAFGAAFLMGFAAFLTAFLAFGAAFFTAFTAFLTAFLAFGAAFFAALAAFFATFLTAFAALGGAFFTALTAFG